jgi:16S rRNA (guanine527-N7)-methyltransferase
MTSHAPLLPELDVSRETLERLEVFVAVLRKWSSRINLVSERSLEDIWHRHVLDSGQLYALAPKPFEYWLDLGSGAGFPGLVIAAIAAEKHPQARVTLVESDQRKAAFLRSASRETGLPITIHARRAEELPPQAADIVSARALAGLDSLLGLAHRHLRPGGTGIFPKGMRWVEEVAHARDRWSFSVQSCKSLTDAQAAILKVGEITHV